MPIRLLRDIPASRVLETLRAPRLRRTLCALLSVIYLVSPLGVLAAPPVPPAIPVADPNAPANQRPVVTNAGGVPVVQVVAPDANGISHNKYQNFNVPAQGAVLNNATTTVNTNLAGSVAANPNLGGTAARVILNEVTSTDPSKLLGPLEVAGNAARVIVANPNGITCNGCGFINTPHVQLTTGRPYYDPSGQLGFDVQGGRIDIGAPGLTNLAYRLDLIGRQIAINGEISTSGELNLVAGAQKVVTAESGTRETQSDFTYQNSGSEYAIDISQSVRAGTIRLVANGGGIGVRSTAPIVADQDIVLSATQSIEVDRMTAGRDLLLENEYSVHGSFEAARTLQFLTFSPSELTLLAGTRLKAGEDVQIGILNDPTGYYYPVIINQGTISAGRDVLIASRGAGCSRDSGCYKRFDNDTGGRIKAGRDVRIGTEDAAFDLLPQAASLRSIQASPLNTERGDSFLPLINRGHLEAGRNANIAFVNNAQGTIDAEQDITLTLAGGYAEPGSANAGGTVHAKHDIHVSLNGNANGSIRAENDLFVSASLPADEAGLVLGAPGLASAGRDIYFTRLPDEWYFDGDSTRRFLSGWSASNDRYSAGRDVLIDSAKIFGTNDTADLAHVVRIFNPYVIDAARDIKVRTRSSFGNLGTLHAGRDISIDAASFANTPGTAINTEVTQGPPPTDYTGANAWRQRDYSQNGPEPYPGCRTDNGGACVARVEYAPNPARMIAGHDIAITAASVENLGGTITAGNDLIIATNAFANDVRRLYADWSSSYSLLVPPPPRPADTIGGTESGTAEAGPPPVSYSYHYENGSAEVGQIPSLIQVGGTFSLNGPSPGTTPPAPTTPTDPSPPPSPDPAPRDPTVTPPPARSFINTQTILANSIYVNADFIRNGYDFTADHSRATAASHAAPSSIDLMLAGQGAPAAGSAGLMATLGPDDLVSLLPASLRPVSPFALTGAEEEAALREAALRYTGQAWFIPGLAWSDGVSVDAQQHALLLANAVTWATENQTSLGTALSSEQIAALTAPMLWYVEQDGKLVPRVYLPPSLQQQLATLEGGRLQGTGVSLTGQTLDNTGFILADGVLSLDVDTLRNRKRNAEMAEVRQEVDHGYVRYWGDTVQPGGYMQAALWDLHAQNIDSVSGEFHVTGATAEESEALSTAFEDELRAQLGAGFSYSEAHDNIQNEFVCTDCKKRKFRISHAWKFDDWFKKTTLALLVPTDRNLFAANAAQPGTSYVDQYIVNHGWAYGAGKAIVSVVASYFGGPYAGSGASASWDAYFNWRTNGDMWAARRAGGKSFATSVATNYLTDTTAGAVKNGTIDLSTRWFIDTLGKAAISSTINGTSFEDALVANVLNSIAAYGAKTIGDGYFGTTEGSAGHALAHATFAALMAKATNKDPGQAAAGAAVSALFMPYLADALGATGLPQPIQNAIDQAIASYLGYLVGGETGAGAAVNTETNNRQLHPKEQQLLRQRVRDFVQQLKGEGINLSEDDALKLLAERAANRIDEHDQRTPDYTGNLAYYADKFLYQLQLENPKGFLDNRGLQIKYFATETTDGRKLNSDFANPWLYADTYNTPESQEFAYKYLGGRNLIGSNPTPGMIQTYLQRESDANKRALYGTALLLGGGAVATAGPVIASMTAAAVRACLSAGVLCLNQLGIVASDVALSEALPGGLGATLAAGAKTADAIANARQDASLVSKIIDEERALNSLPKPRIDVTDRFVVTPGKDGGMTLKYGNPDGVSGIVVNVDKNGVLGFDVRASKDPNAFYDGSGIDMFSSSMQRLAQEGVPVNKIRGAWVEGSDSVNYAQFSQNLSAGMNPVDAAKNTWTGKLAAWYGYTKVEKIEKIGEITYVTFGK